MDFLYSLYFSVPNYARFGRWGKAINKVLAIILKRIFDFYLPFYFIKRQSKAGSGLNSSVFREKKYIVSITSYPGRINRIWISLETVMRQSFKPDAIILWLSIDQFSDKQIPSNLISLIDRGLTIRFCEEDLKSHKKYYYAIQEFPNDIIITLDDDLYYPKDVLKNIVELNHKFPCLIATNRAHKFTFKNGSLITYRDWIDNVTDCEPSDILVQTGGAGTLYPPGCFDKEVFNKDVFKELCFFADDLWLKIMGFRNKTKVVTNDLYNKDFITTPSTQKDRLVVFNVLNKGNDLQLQNICRYYQIDLSVFNI